MPALLPIPSQVMADTSAYMTATASNARGRSDTDNERPVL